MIPAVPTRVYFSKFGVLIYNPVAWYTVPLWWCFP
jgi:hypothetical protein